MKPILYLLALSTVCTASVLVDELLSSEWYLFKKINLKVYESAEIELQRRLIWESNWRYIYKHNQEVKLGKHTFTLAMNKFGDLTNLEFARIYNGFNATKSMHKRSGHLFSTPSDYHAPDSVDWRTQGYVTPIKDQGQCGSCWAFSAVASLEGQHFKAAGKLVSLSEQNLVDCSRPQGNMGCDGGLMDQAFTYIKINKGIDTEESYPYHASDQKCQFNPSSVGATDTGFSDVTPGSEKDLVTAIASVGPISVAIDASQSSFQFYSKGIYSDKYCSSQDLDHGVTAVGYGSLGANQDYYIVKNSWGTSWGDQGYILMARNKKNMCGIASLASYPIV